MLGQGLTASKHSEPYPLGARQGLHWYGALRGRWTRIAFAVYWIWSFTCLKQFVEIEMVYTSPFNSREACDAALGTGEKTYKVTAKPKLKNKMVIREA